MPARSKNQILRSIPQKTYSAIAGSLETVELEFGSLIYEAGAPITHAYFPERGIISLLSAVDTDATLEVGIVGSEGMVGLQLYLGEKISNTRAVVQGPGTAQRMSRAAFLRECKRDDALPSRVRRFTHRLMSQIARSAACNRYHNIDARLARWLLMSHDRMRSDEFQITHDFLSNMLGIRREAVTKAAAGLQKAGLIRYARGKLTLLDRKGLEDASCSCYPALALK